MIQVLTRTVTTVGDSRCVTLSPKWLNKYTPKHLHVVYLNGIILIFPTEHANHLEDAFGEAVARIVQHSLTPESANLGEPVTE